MAGIFNCQKNNKNSIRFYIKVRSSSNCILYLNIYFQYVSR